MKERIPGKMSQITSAKLLLKDPIFLRRYWVGLGGVLSQLTLHFAYVRGDNFVIKLSYLFIADVLNLIIVWRSET